MLKTRKENISETIAIVVFIVLIAIVKTFHEPWFDESQAWLIARDSNIFEMVWNVMRYEGHTPLWHLFLYIPAHLGVPFEPGIKLANFVFITLAAVVIIKKSPFPLTIRLFLPFTYFVFYQYGVISRNYSLFTLILLVIAAVFPTRNKKPIKFSLLLALLGGVSAYGMLIAFGIAVAWFIEIVVKHRENIDKFSKTLILTVTDKRFHSLLFLGAINMLYVAILWPMPDRHTPPLNYEFTVGDRIYRLLVAPAGAVFINENPDFGVSSSGMILFICLAGLILIATFFIWTLNRGIFFYSALPYVCVTLFMTFVYFSLHHTGIYALLAIFGIWISLDGKKVFRTPVWARKVYLFFYKAAKSIRIIRRLAALSVICIFCLQIYWSAAASINDIRFPYAPYRDLASFIRENGILGRRIFDYYSVSNYRNTYFTKNLGVLSYFSKNIFYNHNWGEENLSYAAHRKLNDESLIEYLKNADKPEFIIGNDYPLPFYKALFSPSDYVPVASFEGYYMWKDWTRYDSFSFYIRKDLLSEFPQLKVQTDRPALKTEPEMEDDILASN